jgi:hypothetical protein
VADYSAFGSAASDVMPALDQNFSDVDVRVKPEILAPGTTLSAATDGKESGEKDQCLVVSCAMPVSGDCYQECMSEWVYPQMFCPGGEQAHAHRLVNSI